MTIEKIKLIIDEWDPIGLLAMDDCPRDEYDPEAKKLFDRLNNHLSVDESAKIIYDTFIEMFGVDTFFEDLTKCKEIALQILTE